MPQSPPPVRITVAMLTFHRNDELRAAVPELLRHFDNLLAGGDSGLALDLLVIDNDAAGGAEATIGEVGEGRTRYVMEPEPGISAGRNRALDETTDSDLLVFIDDDERPMTGWLGGLVTTWRKYGAGAVSGPVVSVFEGDLDPWVTASAFYSRLHRAGLVTGSPITRAATNNLLLDLGVLRRVGLRFDSRFGLSGGGDSMFTEQLSRSGVSMVWCQEAMVTDRVPADRMTKAYVIRRTFSLANVSIRVDIAVAGGRVATIATRAKAAAVAVARIALGGLDLTIGRRSLVRRAKGRLSIARGLGALAAASGFRYSEYGRGHTG